MTLITPLLDEEIPELAAFINECWRTTYGGFIHASFLAGLTAAEQSMRLRGQRDRGQVGVLARSDDGELVGVVTYGPTHLEVLGDAGEIGKLYVHAPLIGTGLGHRLLTIAEDALTAMGYSRIGLDVFTANQRAVDFYHAHGYVTVGRKIDHIEGHDYPLDIMAKDMPSLGSTETSSTGHTARSQRLHVPDTVDVVAH
ncbi:MAG: GNAT family N-acetyltransferase [Propionibacteriaceae bacterium]|nr:GNAT family N-acetyltransferase [Propionibacteriaceae bacterium]